MATPRVMYELDDQTPMNGYQAVVATSPMSLTKQSGTVLVLFSQVPCFVLQTRANVHPAVLRETFCSLVQICDQQLANCCRYRYDPVRTFRVALSKFLKADILGLPNRKCISLLWFYLVLGTEMCFYIQTWKQFLVFLQEWCNKVYRLLYSFYDYGGSISLITNLINSHSRLYLFDTISTHITSNLHCCKVIDIQSHA